MSGTAGSESCWPDLAGEQPARTRPASCGQPRRRRPRVRARGQPPPSRGGRRRRRAPPPRRRARKRWRGWSWLPPSGNYAPQTLAAQKGYFREEGLEATSPVMRSQLIATGLPIGIDYAGSFSPSVRNTLAGMPVPGIVAGTVRGNRWMVRRAGDPVDGTAPARRSSPRRSAAGRTTRRCGARAFRGRHEDGDHLGHGARDRRTPARHAAGRGTGRAFTVSEAAASPSARVGAASEPGGDRTLAGGADCHHCPQAGDQRDQVRRVTRAMLRALQYIKADREGSNT